LIIRGFEHLETYKKSFNAGTKDDFVKVKKPVVEKIEDRVEVENEEPELSPAEEKVPITEKIKQMISRMFEVEDQKIS
jgi:hypothetical protein